MSLFPKKFSRGYPTLKARPQEEFNFRESMSLPDPKVMLLRGVTIHFLRGLHAKLHFPLLDPFHSSLEFPPSQ